MKKELFPLLKSNTLTHTTCIRFLRSPRIVYRTLLDVEQYPFFMPWCKNVVILNKSVEGWTIDLTLGFPPVFLVCNSVIHMHEPYGIRSVFAKNKLFELLELEWKLHPGVDALLNAKGVVPVHTCDADYLIKFKFASPAFHSLTKLVFNTVCTKTAHAFEKQVNQDADTRPALYDTALKEFVLAK